MAQADRVGETLIERGAAVFQQGLHLGVQGAQHDQAAAHPGSSGQPVHCRLQIGGEREQGLAAEILELIERHDPALSAEFPDAHRQGAQVMGQRRVHPEVLHEVAGGAHHPRRVGVGDLDVEQLLLTLRSKELLHQPGLADAPPPGDLQEEPAPTPQNLRQLSPLASPAVEAPLRHLALYLRLFILVGQRCAGLGFGVITG